MVAHSIPERCGRRRYVRGRRKRRRSADKNRKRTASCGGVLRLQESAKSAPRERLCHGTLGFDHSVGIGLSRIRCTALPAGAPLYVRPRACLRAPQERAEGWPSSLLISCSVAWQLRASRTVHCVFRIGAQALGSPISGPVGPVCFLFSYSCANIGHWLLFALRIRKRSDRPDRFESETSILGRERTIACRIRLNDQWNRVD